MNLSFNFNKFLSKDNLVYRAEDYFDKIHDNFFKIDLRRNINFNLFDGFAPIDNRKSNFSDRNTVNHQKKDFICICYYCRNSFDLAIGDRQNNPFQIPSLNSNSSATFNNSIIDALVYPEGYKWNTKQITYSFYEDSVFQGNYYSSETGVREVSEPVKNNVRAILDWLETFVALKFVEVAETVSNVGKIRYMLSNEPNYAYAYVPISRHPVGGDVHLSATFDNKATTNGFQGGLGTHGFMTLVHETLHTLGLKHPGNYNGNGLGTGTFLNYGRDNNTNTLMSYNFTASSAATPMPYDILALQYIYGANNNYHLENTSYQFNTVDNYQLGIQNFSDIAQADQNLKSTIWDAGGIDTLDFSALDFKANGYHLDLRQGGIIATTDDYNSYGYQAIGDRSNAVYQTTDYGTAIAYKVTIENAIGSSSNDNIIGNAAINILEGGSGKDTIKGGMGADIFAYRPLESLTNDSDTLIDFELGETIRIYNDNLDLSVEEAVFDRDSQELGLNLRFDGSDSYLSQIDLSLPNLDSDLLIYQPKSLSELNFNANFQRNDNLAENYTDFTFQTRKATIGEFGKVANFDGNSRTIELQNTYVNPVVFALPLSNNGSDPAIARITDIQNDSFQAFLQEAEYLDGTHTQEAFSYMVLEAGSWQLDDGTLLEVGKVDRDRLTTSAWHDIDFNVDFDTNPVILSQVQTKHGRQFVRTRQQEADRNGFKLSMEEEEALNTSGHFTETLGWMALEPGSGSWGNLEYQAGHTKSQVDHQGYSLEFTSEFDNTPSVFASLASFYGKDSAGLRYQNLTSDRVEIVVEEDRSLDSETNHAPEIVDFLAVSGSDDLTATAYEPDLIQ